MSSITTKQLRDNMADVVRDLQQGKSITLSYRHKIIGTLQPADYALATPQRGSAAAVAEFLSTANFGSVPTGAQNADLTFKQELANLRDADIEAR